MFCCFQCIGVNIYNYVYVLYLVLQRVDRFIQVNICTVPLLNCATPYDNTKVFSFKYTHNISQYNTTCIQHTKCTLIIPFQDTRLFELLCADCPDTTLFTTPKRTTRNLICSKKHRKTVANNPFQLDILRA